MKNLFDVAGKVVLVTGGSRGIGKMIAQGFAENGAKVYVSSRKAGACDETAAELSALGECIALPALRRCSSPPARIINIASINGIVPPALETYAYSSSKAASIMLTR